MTMTKRLDKLHTYKLTTEWTGNTGIGTATYRSYERSVTVQASNKVDILCTSDTAFNSDPSKHNPEELLLAAISSCHLLWYLHLCSEAGIVVVTYTDHATATMTETSDGGGRFTEAILHPKVTVKEESMIEKAQHLHERANELCYIANSCNFPVLHKATVTC